MRNIKIIYRVDKSYEIEEEIAQFLTRYLSKNRQFLSKELFSLSVRVSYKPSPESKQVYATLIDTNYDIIKYPIKDILTILKSRFINRNIDIKTITSLHLHLQYQ
jgi:hypothetical protein